MNIVSKALAESFHKKKIWIYLIGSCQQSNLSAWSSAVIDFMRLIRAPYWISATLCTFWNL